MLSLISPILLVLAAGYLFVKHQWHRLACALAVFVPTYIHFRIYNLSEDWEYYGSAIAASALIISLLQIVKPNDKPSELVVHLQIISILFMAVNLAGYVMWLTYQPPFWYDISVLVLVIAEVTRLFLHTDGDKKDGTDGAYYSWIDRYLSHKLGRKG